MTKKSQVASAPDAAPMTEAEVRQDERQKILALAPRHEIKGRRKVTSTIAVPQSVLMLPGQKGGDISPSLTNVTTEIVEGTTREFTNPSTEYLAAYSEGFADAVALFRKAIEGLP